VVTDRSETPTNLDPILVDFALQGGGAHGAFTWGALDRLLEEPWLQIDGIAGTSAGAMNAAVLIDGHAQGGAEGARAHLESFWRRVSQAASLSPLRRGFLDVLLDRWSLDHSPVFLAMDLMARLFSPLFTIQPIVDCFSTSKGKGSHDIQGMDRRCGAGIARSLCTACRDGSEFRRRHHGRLGQPLHCGAR
jgi:predicted acylesterase/phospholipase RssA